MNITETLQILGFFLAAISSLLAVKVYKDNKKKELQNVLFKTKLEAYSEIIYQTERLFSAIRKLIHFINRNLEEGNEIDETLANKLAEDIEHIVFDCDLMLVKYSAYFPEHAILSLRKLSKALYGRAEAEDMKQAVTLMNNNYKKQLELANKANSELRKHLKLDTLSESLFNRY